MKKNRHKRPMTLGFQQTPFDPITGKYLSLTSGDGSDSGASGWQVKELLVARERDNYLECYSDLDADEAAGGVIIVAKPWLLRADSYLEIDCFTRISENTRLAVLSETVEEYQIITPDYGDNVNRAFGTIIDEKILVCRADITLSDAVCEWTDLNTAGRCWAAAPMGWVPGDF